MNNFIMLISQRRIWAGIFGAIAILLPMFGVQLDFSAESWTDAVMQVIEAISALATMILPVISYFKPKDGQFGYSNQK